MSFQTFSALDILEAELADVYDWFLGQFLGVGGKVPRFHPIATQLHHVDVLHPCDDVIRTVASTAPGRLLLETARSWGEGPRERGGTAFS